VIDYNGRKFRKADGDPDTVAVYHQEGDVVWAEFAGGQVLRGSIAGVRRPDGSLYLGYTMVLTAGEVICGHTVNTPELLDGGRLRLHEAWQRYGPHAASGVSCLEEVR
jgi:hypothetical protein